MRQLAQNLLDWFLPGARFGQRRFYFGNTLLAERVENVFFGLEIIEEGSLTHIGGLGDVFNRGVCKAAFGEQAQRAAHQAFAGFRVAALAPAGTFRLTAAVNQRAALSSEMLS